MGFRKGELNCKDVVALVTEREEAALSPESCRDFDDHLAGCGDCRTYVAQMKSTVEAVSYTREKPRAALTEATKTCLVDAFRELRTKNSPR